MIRTRIACLALLLAFLASPLAFTAPTPEQIASWVRDLGADDFRTREDATRKLEEAGQAAEAALERASHDDDPEVVRRARALLIRFRWGIYPDTPPEVVTLIHRYRTGNQSIRRQTVRDLLTRGKPGFVAVRKFVTLETNEGERRWLTTQLAQESWRLASTLVAEGDFKQAEQLLDAGLSSGNELLCRHHAAFHLWRGSAERKAKELRQRIGSVEHSNLALALLYLCRAREDYDGALWAAAQTGRPELTRSLLDEMGEWKRVADLLPSEGKPSARTCALRAMFLRLAGEREAFAAEVRRLEELKDPGQVTFYYFNGFPDKAITLGKKAGSVVAAFQILEAQGRYAEALRLHETDGMPAKQKDMLDVERAQLLIKLGNTDEGKKLLAATAERLATEPPDYRHRRLLEAASKVGAREEAFAHLARFLERSKPPGKPELLFRGVFPDHSQLAVLLWQAWNPRGETRARLEQLRDVLERKKPGKDFFPWLESLAEEGGSDGKLERLNGAGEICEVLGKLEQARTYREKAIALQPTAPALLALGDLHARAGKWSEAARAYGRAWEVDRKQTAPLYLQGRALIQAGKEKEGRALIERARWLPLADEARRYTLIEALKKRGLEKESAQESELLVRTSTFHSVYTANVVSYIASAALRQKDYHKAARQYDRIALILMQGGGAFLDSRAYLIVPARALAYRLRGHLADGKVAEALRVYHDYSAYFPADTRLASDLVRDLDARGHRQEADMVFKEVWDFWKRQCQEHPGAALCHNRRAWFAVLCGRRLDEALANAREATRIAPNNARYLDTLAEIHFARGDRDKAAEVMRRCIHLDPDNERYRDQLRRFTEEK
jgi:tetratricopeptide (TPR) repeat protein